MNQAQIVHDSLKELEKQGPKDTTGLVNIISEANKALKTYKPGFFGRLFLGRIQQKTAKILDHLQLSDPTMQKTINMSRLHFGNKKQGAELLANIAMFRLLQSPENSEDASPFSQDDFETVLSSLTTDQKLQTLEILLENNQSENTQKTKAPMKHIARLAEALDTTAHNVAKFGPVILLYNERDTIFSNQQLTPDQAQVILHIGEEVSTLTNPESQNKDITTKEVLELADRVMKFATPALQLLSQAKSIDEYSEKILIPILNTIQISSLKDIRKVYNTLNKLEPGSSQRSLAMQIFLKKIPARLKIRGNLYFLFKESLNTKIK